MLAVLNTYLIGKLVPVLLIGAGIWFWIDLGGYPFVRARKVCGNLFRRRSTDGVSPFRALTLALAGTLGVGNIVGVAGAIYMGGPGAVFWMWISAIAALVLKYAEVLLGVAHRRTGRDGSHYGGAFYYMQDGLRARGCTVLSVVLPAVFALFCILNALSMGCVVQVNAVSRAFLGTLGISPYITGGVLAGLVLLVIFRGTGGVSALTEKLVPFMTVLYVLLSLAVIWICRADLGSVFSEIFCSAFAPESAAGGIFGFFTSRALRFGTMRGLISNEAGCGTAPTAHATARTDSPVEQGFFGVLEVLIDTILLCTVSAVVVLLRYDTPGVGSVAPDGMLMSIRAYSSVLGVWVEPVIAVAVLLFGFATLICWAEYGAECIRFLGGGQRILAGYRILFAACVFGGALVAPDSVWDAADFAIGVMTLLNIFALWLSRREIRARTRQYFGKCPTEPVAFLSGAVDGRCGM